MKIKIIVLGVLLLSVLGNYFLWRGYSSRGDTIRVEKANEKAYIDTISSTKDAMGRLVYEHNALQKTAVEIRKENGKLAKDIKELIGKASIKPENIVSYSFITSGINIKSFSTKASKDSIYNFNVNPEFTARVAVLNGQATLYANITNQQSVAFLDKRETVYPPKRFFIARWLQRRHTVVKALVRNSNPDIVVTEINAVHIIKK